jgi:hypothetical protein
MTGRQAGTQQRASRRAYENAFERYAKMRSGAPVLIWRTLNFLAARRWIMQIHNREFS